MIEPIPSVEVKQVSEEEAFEASVARVKALVHDIVTGAKVSDEDEAALHMMPREILITAAWQGIAQYHSYDKAGRIKGDAASMARDKVYELEKDFRQSLLTEEEQVVAINKANAWLDENFAD